MTFMIFIVLCALSFQKVNSRGLIDEVAEEIEQLRSIVMGSIDIAHDKLDDLFGNFVAYSHNINKAGEISLDEQYQTFYWQADTIRTMAISNGINASICVDAYVGEMGEWLDDYKKGSSACVTYQNNRVRGFVGDSKYVVDVVMSKVDHLDFETIRCNGEFLCLAPLIAEIGLDKVRLPENIRTEVAAVESLSFTLRLSVEDCVDFPVNQYAGECSSMIRTIVRCVDSLVDGTWKVLADHKSF